MHVDVATIEFLRHVDAEQRTTGLALGRAGHARANSQIAGSQIRASEHDLIGAALRLLSSAVYCNCRTGDRARRHDVYRGNIGNGDCADRDGRFVAAQRCARAHVDVEMQRLGTPRRNGDLRSEAPA